MQKHHPKIQGKGFTIVELLIVIVVIGILAGIVSIGYSGIKKNATINMVKDGLRSASKAMVAANIENTVYPTTLPSSIKPGTNVGYALAVTDANAFCINGTTLEYNDIAWHSDHTQVVTEGLCPGSVISASIIGSYNSQAAGGTAPIQETSIGTATGDGGGFVVKTNADWTAINITWDAVVDASRYELQYRQNLTSPWYYANLSNGAGPYGVTTSSGNSSVYTGQIPASTTSIDWTSAAVRPLAAGDTYQYRIRPYIGGVAANTWYTATLAVPANSTFRTIDNLSVAVNSTWTSHTINWTGNNTATMPGARYELQYRESPTGTWYLANTSSGAGPYGITSSSIDSSVYTAQIPTTTTSLTWNGVSTRPSIQGQTYEYRIRIKSATLTDVYGPWTTTSLSPPANNTIPTVSGFTVTANNTWTSHTISWDAVSTPIAPAPRFELQYRTSSSGTWYLANTSSGAGPFATSAADTSVYTAQIPMSTNSLTWTTTPSRPTAQGENFEYRVRVRANSAVLTDVYGPWTTTSLSPPANNTIPTVSGFTVTPNAGQTNITLAWDNVSTPVAPAPRYEIQYRSSPTGTWYLANTSSGAGPYAVTATDTAVYSAQIAMGTNSLTWTGSRPTAAGQTYEYRIRVRANSGVLSNVFGEWTTVSVSR